MSEFASLVEAADPRSAFGVYAEKFFDGSVVGKVAFGQLVDCLERISDPAADGFRLQLTSGAVIEWGTKGGAPTALWFYRDRDDRELGNHSLFFGEDAGPPDADAELVGTAFAASKVAWFLQELPEDRYWFTVDGAPSESRCFEFDGGLHTELAGPPLEVLITRVAALLG